MVLSVAASKGNFELAPGGAPAPAEQERQVVLLRALIERTVAAAFEVEPELLRMPTRGSHRVALARHVAMYLAHVSCRLTYTEVGAAFGRDRSTAAHACRRIEQRRDDPAFDRAIGVLESIVRVLAGMWPPDG